MAKTVKLKSNWAFIVLVSLAALGSVAVSILSRSGIVSEKTLALFLLLVFTQALVEHLLLFIRTRNPGFAVFILLYLDIALFFLLRFIKNDFLWLPMLYAAIPLVLLGILVLVSGKIRPRGRRILELAAMSVDEKADGFTARPFPVGKSTYTKEEIMGFTGFLSRHLVVSPRIQEDRVYLVINASEISYLTFRWVNIQRKTYVAFDFSGHISIHIAKRDYRRYKDELTFDRLCRSLGDLFKQFLILYQRGESQTVIDMMDQEA